MPSPRQRFVISAILFQWLDVRRWNEDLRFRLKDNEDIGTAILHIAVKDAPGSGINLGGSIIGKATIDASIIIGELDKLRAEALNAGLHSLVVLAHTFACRHKACDVVEQVQEILLCRG